MARMHALRRDIASTAKSDKTTRKSASSVRDVIGAASPDDEDQTEQPERGRTGDVHGNLRQPEARDERLDNADRDAGADHAGEQREPRQWSTGPAAGDQDVEHDGGEDRELERARVENRREI